MEEGLVDAADDFKSLSQLRNIWDSREENYNCPPDFYTWFVESCKDTVFNAEASQNQGWARSASHLTLLYHKDVEYYQEAGYLPQFIMAMKEMIISQKRRLKKLSSTWVNIILHFNSMNATQRERHLKKVFEETILSDNQPSGLIAKPSMEENPLIILT